jgi:hypothetical protein
MLKHLISALILTLNLSASAAAQNVDPPKNRYLADSPYPMGHLNPYSQDSTSLRGPEPGDVLEVTTATPRGLSVGRSAPLPLLSERYSNGERVVWGSTGNQIYKALLKPDGIEIVAQYLIDFTPLFMDQSMYNVLLKGNHLVVPDGKYLRMFTDAKAGDARSAIRLEQSFRLPSVLGTAGAVNLTYDGRIVFGAVKTTLSGSVFSIGIIKSDFTDLEYIQIEPLEGEKARNNIALDDEGGIYVVTSKRVIRVQWDGAKLSIGWTCLYDMGPDGSGTTPSLMGFGNGDKLVLITDGNIPNNLVALWRDEIPSDWLGLGGYDRRIAAVRAAPFSTSEGKGVTNENSPAVRGYGIAFAQWNGILSKDCDPAKGVQKFQWNPETRTLDLAWATDAVNMNNVLFISGGSNLVYGIGRSKDCTYHLYMLDWSTGVLAGSLPLGTSSDFYNPGNTLAVDEDRRLISTSLKGIVSIRPLVSGGGDTAKPKPAPSPIRKEKAQPKQIGPPKKERPIRRERLRKSTDRRR